MGALSWNGLLLLVAFSRPEVPGSPTILEFDASDPFRQEGCSFAQPTYCANVQSLFQVSGVQRNTVRAGGTSRFGRRDFTWQGGRDLVLRYEKRNILGFSLDFAEDVTKSSWGIEATWQEGLTFADYDSADGLARGVDTYNVTVSIDRPTFINFLNPNRTFFINTQWFFQYVDGYRESFPTSGPFNVLAVLLVDTGYFDDRLQPRWSLVYDFRSNSGAFIPQVSYRFTAEFSATFGAAFFVGREETRPMPLSPNSLVDRAGRRAYTEFVENGLSAVRDRDELFLRLRYTF
jgi:hypothetical protein